MKNSKFIVVVFAAISLLLAVQLIPSSIAHNTEHVDDDIGHHMYGSHMEHHNMMGMNHGMMMGCHEMMEEYSIEEMDKDGDGICDFCGMSIEHCDSMMGWE